jgi:hypothetical protein
VTTNEMIGVVLIGGPASAVAGALLVLFGQRR